MSRSPPSNDTLMKNLSSVTNRQFEHTSNSLVKIVFKTQILVCARDFVRAKQSYIKRALKKKSKKKANATVPRINSDKKTISTTLVECPAKLKYTIFSCESMADNALDSFFVITQSYLRWRSHNDIWIII